MQSKKHASGALELFQSSGDKYIKVMFVKLMKQMERHESAMLFLASRLSPEDMRELQNILSN